MKAFTIAAALDAGAITTSTKVVDDNNLRIGKVRIQNADRYSFPYGHGEITAADVLKLSNNVGAAKIGLTLGGRGLYDAFKRYGFGSPTGVDIAGEVPGVVWDPDGPHGSGDLTTAQNSFGQGLSRHRRPARRRLRGDRRTAACSSRRTSSPAGPMPTAPTTTRRRPAPAGSCARRPRTPSSGSSPARSTMASRRRRRSPATRSRARRAPPQIAGPREHTVVDGYDAQGKPIYKKVTRFEYINGWIDSSFIGVYPASNPQLVTLILLNRPATWGRYVMAERPDQVFADLGPQILDYLAIPPDRSGGSVASR